MNKNDTPDNTPVFPQLTYEERISGIGTFTNPDLPGLLLRDYFAAKVLPYCIEKYYAGDACKEAYRYADAMLKQRNS